MKSDMEDVNEILNSFKEDSNSIRIQMNATGTTHIKQNMDKFVVE